MASAQALRHVSITILCFLSINILIFEYDFVSYFFRKPTLTNKEADCFDGPLCSCVELKYSHYFTMVSSELKFLDAVGPFSCNQQPWTLMLTAALKRQFSVEGTDWVAVT